MTVASQRANWSRLPLRAAAFVVLTCATILGVSAWREWTARDAVLKGAETEMANVARSLTHQDNSRHSEFLAVAHLRCLRAAPDALAREAGA